MTCHVFDGTLNLAELNFHDIWHYINCILLYCIPYVFAVFQNDISSSYHITNICYGANQPSAPHN